MSLALLLAASLTAADRPNILFIITDDQSPETLDCYGDSYIDTPVLDRLAREGMVLDDAHHMGAWIGAVCTCSRTMIMTGRTVWRIPGRVASAKQRARHAKLKGPNGTGRYSTPEEAADAASRSLPAVFNAAGYDTFRTCKTGNSFPAANKLFAQVHDKGCRGPDPENGSPWHAERVLEFLAERESTNDEDPFLIYFGFSHPHDPRDGPPELIRKYQSLNDGAGPPLMDNYLNGHPFPHGHPELRDEEQVAGVLKDRSEPTVRRELAREAGCIESVDTQVGRVLDKLRAMGDLDNTYVFFTSDHGMSVGRHGLMGKQNLYEHTWKVPMIVRGPGIRPGSRASGYTYLLDVLRTVCDLADIEPPEGVEGESFAPVLRGEADRVRDVLYGVYAGGTKPGIRSVKSDGWKLIEYDALDGDLRRTQLFDLRNNPREFLTEHGRAGLHSLHQDPDHADKLQEMRGLLAAQMKDLGDPYELAAP